MMAHTRWVILIVMVGAGLPSPAAAAALRRARFAIVDLAAPLPPDLTAPEGKSRWDLTGVEVESTVWRNIEAGDAEIRLAEGETLTAFDTRPEEAGEAARRWLLPDRSPEGLRPGRRETLELDATVDGRPVRLRIEVETVGIGWVHLPSGPREAVLQRALIFEGPAGGRGLVPARLAHRWVDPRAGVVAEIAGPVAPGGRSRLSVASALVAEQVTAAADLKIYVDELDDAPLASIAYGWDRGAGTTVASLTPEGHTTIGALVAADAWDFSDNTSGAEVASTSAPVNAAETCNASQCGYNPGGAHPGRVLSREDKNFGTPSLRKINAVTEREQRAADVTLWLRGGALNEGVSGGIGEGESRFCYANDGGTRSPVPLWRFPNQDAAGWYMQAGDPAYVGGPFACEQNLYNSVCGGTGTFSTLYTKGCTSTSGFGVHPGTQEGQVLKGGVVTLPSGHTFNTLLGRTVADYCVYLGSACSSFFKVAEVRAVVHLWQVPHLGTVVRLQSANLVSDTTSYTTLAETDIKFGLFPPRSIAALPGPTDTTVDLLWDPGLDTHRIDGYRVHWGTASGAGTPYPFNSIDNPGQVSFAGTTATVSGLSPGTTYYFTVTSRSTFTNPSSGVVTTFESLLYPTTVSGDPAFVYPVEVQATTTGGICIPAAEVTGVTVQHDGTGIRICWDPVSDPCLAGYRILGADSPEAAGNFTPQADTGLETCFTGAPSGTFFLVVARGTGGTGPWGHYGQ